MIHDVRTAYPQCTIRGGLKRQGCKVNLTGVPDNRIIIDFDKPGSPIPSDTIRCDYLVILLSVNSYLAIPLELKSEKLLTTHAVKQLQAGTDFVDQMASSGSEYEIKIMPVAVFGKISKQQRIEMKSKGKVRYRGKYVQVRVMKCNTRLDEAIYGSVI